MAIQQNLSVVMRMFMEKRQMSLTEFSKELDISRTALQAYLRGEGNPSVSTIEHMANKLGVDPSVLVTGLLEPDQMQIAMRLFETIRDVAELPEDRKRRFGKCISEAIDLWSD